MLTAALERRGVDAEVVEWDDPAADWGAYGVVVVRSTWDYAPRRDEFLAWAARVAAATDLANPSDVLRWNTDKRYLRDLERSGVPIVPTTWLTEGDAAQLDDVLGSSDVLGSGDVVVKPVISAGAVDTSRYPTHRAAEARAHARRLLTAGRGVIVQPYVGAIDEQGEAGLVFAAGRFSHAIRKAPILRPTMTYVDGLYAEERITPRSASSDEVELAERILDLVPGGRARLLYARVDLVPGHDGPLLLELEVTEPSLFLDCAPGSEETFADATVERIR